MFMVFLSALWVKSIGQIKPSLLTLMLEKGVRDMCCQRQSPLSVSVWGHVPHKFLKLMSLKMDFWHSQAKSACYHNSFFNLCNMWCIL